MSETLIPQGQTREETGTWLEKCEWRVWRRGAWEYCGQSLNGKQYCERHEKSAKRKK